MSEKIFQKTKTDNEEANSLLRTYENDILGGLLAAAGFREDEEEIYPVEIRRNGVLLFRFRIRPLTEEEYNDCHRKNTKYIRNKQLGIKMPDETNTARYRSSLIYQATVKEDREKVWDNKEAWRALNVLNGIDLIDQVLKAGEKDGICDRIDQISGYSATMEETAKN